MDFARIAFGGLAGASAGALISFTLLVERRNYKKTGRRNVWPTVWVTGICLAGIVVLGVRPQLRTNVSIPALVSGFFATAFMALLVAYLSSKKVLPAPRATPILDSVTYRARQKINQGEFDQALELARRALAGSSRDLGAYIEKGRALKRLGRVQEALQTVEEGLKVKGDDPRLLYNRACYLSLLRQDASHDAVILADLQTAIRLMPKLKENVAMDPDLENVRHLKDFEGVFKGAA